MKRDGENFKACSGCRKKFVSEGYFAPCETCEREKEPKLLPENIECFEVHQLCWPCREGMSGGLDYAFVGTVLDRFGFENAEWIETLRKIQRVEGELRTLKDGEKCKE